jgi:hypothetical protein
MSEGSLEAYFCCRANWLRRLFGELGALTRFGEPHPLKRLLCADNVSVRGPGEWEPLSYP